MCVVYDVNTSVNSLNKKNDNKLTKNDFWFKTELTSSSMYLFNKSHLNRTSN